MLCVCSYGVRSGSSSRACLGTGSWTGQALECRGEQYHSSRLGFRPPLPNAHALTPTMSTGPCENSGTDCAALRREECTQADRSQCGPCLPGYSSESGGPGNDKCDLDCSVASEAVCSELKREPCGSGTANTCGGCLPSYRPPSVRGWQESNDHACTVSCSGVSAQLCQDILHREPCSDTPETCGPCMAGFNSTVQGDNNIACRPHCGEVDCPSLNRNDCTSEPNICGPCLTGYTDNGNTTENSECTLSVTDCTFQPDAECASAHRLPCSSGKLANTCGPCMQGFTEVSGQCLQECDLISSLQCDVVFHRQPCSDQVSFVLHAQSSPAISKHNA